MKIMVKKGLLYILFFIITTLKVLNTLIIIKL